MHGKTDERNMPRKTPATTLTMNSYHLINDNDNNVDHDHSHVINNVRERALSCLRPHLPTSLPLYRRIQFGRFFPGSSLLITNLNLTAQESLAPTEKDVARVLSQPWLMAFVDRSCRPETELWVFGSWESIPESSSGIIENLSVTNVHGQDESSGHLVRLLTQTISSLDLPISIHRDILDATRSQQTHASDSGDDEKRDAGGLTRKDYAAHMLDANVMLWGAVHEKTMRIVQRLGLLAPAFRAGAESNFTFVWDASHLPRIELVHSDPRDNTRIVRKTVRDDTTTTMNDADRDNATRNDLPNGLHWGQLRREHLGLVRSRTAIPRQEKTLAVLPSLAIFHTDDDDDHYHRGNTSDDNKTTRPVAWAFVGLDGSLTSLHVEEDFRRRHLAQALTVKLFGECMTEFWEEGLPHWTHGYVIAGNEASAEMCRGLGGKEMAKSYWLRVNLSGRRAHVDS